MIMACFLCDDGPLASLTILTLNHHIRTLTMGCKRGFSIVTCSMLRDPRYGQYPKIQQVYSLVDPLTISRCKQCAKYNKSTLW